jgi:hypothetical protein
MSPLFDFATLRRPLVLGFAIAAALGALVVSPPEPSLIAPAYAQAGAPVDAAKAKAAPSGKPVAKDAAPAADTAKAAAPAAGTPTPAASDDDATADDDASADSDDTPAPPPRASRKDRHRGASVGITLGDDDKINVHGFGRAREYDSFEDFVDKAPWIAGLFFLGTLLVFLVPLVVIILVLWYKMRKTRMLNETMLKLAEKGVVPPAEAMDAIGASRPQAAMQNGNTTGALYARARSIRARNVWSDLRRGIILVAVGLAVQTCSMFENGEASGIGLVLLFLGIGYVVLWYFEDRRDPVPPTVDTGADRTP